jgi:PAS domain S-box-containing protein
MQALTKVFFDTTNLMPHGYCLVWNSALLWLHVISDALIVLSYYSIPLILLYYIRKHQNFPFNKLLTMFAAFILACGTTHLFSIITLWLPIYWLEGFLKLLTAILSITTAIVLLVLTPKVLAEIGRNQHLEEDIIKNSRIALATFESAQSMYITDSQGYFLNVNQTFSEITGYSMSDLVGKKTNILKSGHHNLAFYKNLWETLITTGYWSGELWNKRKNGDDYFVLVHIVAVKDDQNSTTHYVVTGTDIAQIKAYEAGLIEAKDKAERFSTLKSQFIASMSHEIRTPMTAIIGFSELALFEEMPKEIRGYVQNINTASNSLLGILNDILDYTKLEAGRVVIESIAFNLLDLLDTTSVLFSGAAQQKGLTFTIVRDSSIPIELLGDKLKLQQVLTNLVGNAIKFTAQGSVKLQLTLQSINLSTVQVLFSVTDTGIGIALEDQDKLFIEFSQVDGSFTRKYGGTGLGLVISKELVDLMGGEISVVSVAKQGSTFSFALQFTINKSSMSHTTQSTTISQELPQLPISNKFKDHRVLVVEDNSLAQQLIQKHLANIGIESMLAANGAEALPLLEQHDFNAVLMDIHMPIMNGIEATTLIRQQAKFEKLPIIALSAGVTELDRNNCIACGMNGFIAKPIDVEQLCAVLGLWLKPRAAQ